MYKLRYLTRVLLLTIIAGAIFFSCKKTEYIDYEKEPLNRILSYKVTNAQQPLEGAIDQQNNTITVYVPYYISIEYLVAEIKVDDGATLLDSLGQPINLDGGLEPVKLGNPVKYMVETEKGERRSYTLIQQILPHSSTLSVKISGVADGATVVEKPVFGRLTLLGNFESTSRNAKFYLKDKATGEVHTDYTIVSAVTPGTQYTMDVDISPEAKAGEYEVTMEHQGRSAVLPSLKLYYNRPWVPMLSSSSRYAPGDTIALKVSRQVVTDDKYATVFVGLKEMYMKIAGPKASLPAGFPEEYVDRKLPMKIVSYTGTEVKAIFPEAPAGFYTGGYTFYGSAGGIYYLPPLPGISFYGNFDEQTNWGNDVFIASQIYTGFTILPK
jgi:hypothetical protein